ncbi:MAG TPA: PP2C family protein-serine/threonine phosphatase [Terriglobales bacterium]|nr:PP2C family protein-serine/threonine phosphatase [Terriglobales bacterium]
MAGTAQTQVAELLRDQLPRIIAGTFFVLAALVAFAIASIRRASGVKFLVWLAVWTGIFGINELLVIPAVGDLLPPWLRAFLHVSLSYLVLVAAALAFLQVSVGALRVLVKFLLAADILIAVLGIGAFLTSGSADAFMPINSLLAVVGSTVLCVVVLVPPLWRRYLVLPHHRVLTVGTLVFAAQSVYGNLSTAFQYSCPDILGSLGFAAFLLSFGYTAMDMIVSNERRLLSIDNELAIARQLQLSILPSGVPQASKLRVAASYLPMTSVAGDFYQFLPMDDHHTGFLVADVSGHGVPAALIASMIKTAMHSIDGCAQQPAEVLRRLSTVLFSDLRGQFVSVAYLWIDSESKTATYSAAGHPPLLLWRAVDHDLLRIESNGLLLGVVPEVEFPQRSLQLAAGDRILLYTDGVTEPENEAGEAFGDQRLEQVIRENQSGSAAELSEHLVTEIRSWQSASVNQQDDITLVVIDVL